MALATLGGIPLNTNPDEIRWNFQMKTAEHLTMGGKVIQILGTTLSDISVRGTFSPVKSEGDTEGWEAQIRFRRQVAVWSRQAAATGRSEPLRFTYSPRRWDFKVFIRTISPVDMSEEEFNPTWELALFPVDDGAMDIVNGAKDLYIARLAEGVGWKQTDYNGPTQTEIDNMLSSSGGSVLGYLRDQITGVFNGTIPAGGGQ